MMRNLRLTLLEVSVECGAMVVDVNKNGLTIEVDNHADYISAETVNWAGGIRASSLGQILARRSKAETDRGGRVKVKPDKPNYPNIYVIGDLASALNAQ
jgi:NADH dehydrogenase